MIESWSEEEQAHALSIFKKIHNNNDAWLMSRRAGDIPESYPMPQNLFEAHRLTLKSIASEIGLFDEGGRILLALRPSVGESPSEPWPDLWHIPGTRHVAGEMNAEALERLRESEIGIELEPRLIEHFEYPTGVLTLLYVAEIKGSEIVTSEKRQWFSPEALPHNMIVEQKPVALLMSKCR